MTVQIGMMNPDFLSAQTADWQHSAQTHWHHGNYSQAADLYTQAIETEPQIQLHYWQLGLLLLLQGQEAEAQMTWLMAMAEGEPDQVEAWTLELAQVLDGEAERQEGLAEYNLAWAIRQHLREVLPNHLKNLLHLVWLSAQRDTLTGEEVRELGVMPGLDDAGIKIEFGRVLQVLERVLTVLSPDPIILDFTAACLGRVDDLPGFMAVVLRAAVRIAYELKSPKLAAKLLELYRRLDANDIEILGHLSTFYQNAHCFDLGIEIAQLNYELSEHLADKLFASHLYLRALMSAGGYWQEAVAAIAHHRELMAAIIAAHPTDLSSIQVSRLLTASSFLPYFRDDLPGNRALQNPVMALCQSNAQAQAQAQADRYRIRHTSTRSQSRTDSRIKIGYLSHCMARHSVGYLARWLIQHHDRDRFQLHGYFINDRKYDPLFDWYVDQMEQSHRLSVENANDSGAFADIIYQDDLDILIDLDSLTLDLTCHVLSLKPAPLQVSWLGWDASGLPAIDYFIADPYVLPDWADRHYSEKIWRLPQTYIAVDGFEVDIPTLRRDDLNIPTDAVIYLSAQKGYKRHAETARLQMRVIQGVPNSYFLIKGPADQHAIQRFFEEIAEQEGVGRDRLRFLPETSAESTHRANLGIADVVLDTYPYNGATTTLETLWMGVPLVTRVGDQFAARNSYTMLKNVGVDAGIAWSDEEYVDWGIRLGKDAALRQQIHWTLLRSRQTSPLWNARQFTREMENAYTQMIAAMG